MDILRSLIPVLVFGYVIYKSFAKPIYFTLIPWIVGLGRALFIDILPNTIVANLAGIQLSVQDLLFFLVVIAWLVSCLRRKSSGHFFSHSGIWVSAIWFLFLLIEAFESMTDPTIHLNLHAFFDMRLWFYYPLSFLLIVDTYRRFSRQEFLEAVGAFSVLVTVITVFYILDSGFGFKIYPYDKYYQDFSNGVLITRDFTTLSIFWLGLVLSFLLVTPSSPLMSLVLLIIISLGIFFSYTRSLIIGMVLIFAFAGTLLLVKPLLKRFEKNTAKSRSFPTNKFLHARSKGITVETAASRNNFLFALYVFFPTFLWVLFMALPVLLPVQWNFLAGRFLEAGNVGAQGVSAFPNMLVRWDYFTSAWRSGMTFDHWLGNGLTLHFGVSNWMSYDSDWIHLVFRFGIVGVIVFALPLIWAQWMALSAFFTRSDKTAERLALLILLFNVFAFLQRFVNIVYLWWFPFSTLGIALATVEADQLWYQVKRSVSFRWE